MYEKIEILSNLIKEQEDRKIKLIEIKEYIYNLQFENKELNIQNDALKESNKTLNEIIKILSQRIDEYKKLIGD